jgi:FkbM family methyltransferase
MLKKIISWVKQSMPITLRDFLYTKVICLFITPKYQYELSTFSQAGEDAILRFLFLDYGVELSKISYLDIGARHPTCGSNTFLFYANGSHGVCVEADQRSIPLLKKIRPRDKVLNLAVSSSKNSKGYLYFMEGGGSTIDKKEYQQRVKDIKNNQKYVFEVRLANINTIISKYFKTYPKLLSIDIEGSDLLVLKSLNLEKYPIPVICVETCNYSENYIRPKNPLVLEHLLSRGYEIYADTYINTIYVNKDWFHRVK